MIGSLLIIKSSLMIGSLLIIKSSLIFLIFYKKPNFFFLSIKLFVLLMLNLLFVNLVTKLRYFSYIINKFEIKNFWILCKFLYKSEKKGLKFSKPSIIKKILNNKKNREKLIRCYL